MSSPTPSSSAPREGPWGLELGPTGPGHSLAGSHVRLTLPADAAFGRLARLTASGLAVRHGFGYDEVEQLRQAVDEAVALLLTPSTPAERLAVTFALEPSAITIDLTAELPAPGRSQPTLDPQACAVFTHAIAGLVDEVTVATGYAQVRLTKRTSTDTDG